MVHYERLRSLIERLQPLGARPTGDMPNVWEYDLSNECEDPRTRTLHARREDKGENTRWRVNPGSLSLHLSGIPCRKCRPCAAFRAYQWRERIRQELSYWPRTWFCTFTFRPDIHFVMHQSHLADKIERGWLPSDFVSADAEYRSRCEAAGKQLTTYLKRVRKPQVGEKPVSLRYMAVFEPHKSGLPHMHALIHEAGGPVTWDRLMSRWALGWSTAKLVDDHQAAARYVSKYVLKGVNVTRSRASLLYGQPARWSLENVRKT